eukprot:CAMPEP_0113394950 /NCGR_PEP_ID=MMETSP0013_2-20120614/12864_1 /TAXON_ID=2843 ORGANISM="Skeletonema costatum, Strain 1716" /NCGR_SAMPLE_ID=MMETSP0013_2 /ASSEMBLY_ACC=CAM_ASM_000158 /LENGTH=187 /DNA_ID=CAMNT_0000278989 /DNA_START=62 /DNA_END=625 /DNA_ORIENTATION=- /assembly_acc=CAM_ASM_000158
MARSMLTLCACAIATVMFGHDAAAFAPSAINVQSSATSARQFSTPFTTTANSNAFKESGSRTKSTSSSSSLNMSEKSNLPVFLDPGTKGGAIVLSLILFVIPIVIYQVATGVFGVDEIEAGRDIGVGFSVITMLLWGSTYIFRVATKDMTYAKQLKDYEDAVIAKRLEELDEDEVQALVEDIEREQF